MLRGIFPGIVGSAKASISIATPFEKRSWLTPEENAAKRRARSLRVVLATVPQSLQADDQT